jgi:hypothetical protein
VSTARLSYPGPTSYVGWTLSFFLHGLAVWCSLLLVTSLSLPPDTNIFRWEVALVNPVEPAPENVADLSRPVDPHAAPSRAGNVAKQLMPLPSRVTPIERSTLARPMQTTPVMENIQSVVVKRREQPIVREDMETLASLARNLTPAEPVHAAAQAVTVPVESPENAVHHEPVTTSELIRHQRVVEEMSPVSSASPAEVVVPLARERHLVETTPQPSLVQEQQREQHVEKLAALVPLETTAPKLDPTKDERRANIRPLRLPKADYSWLPAMLERAIGEVRFADVTYDLRGELSLRIFHGELKIYLEDIVLSKSTGHAEADRLVLERIKKAFPMKSTQSVLPIDRVQKFSIPFDITYHKERKRS